MPMDSMECIQCRVIDAQYETNWPLCQLHALFDSFTHAQCLFFSADAHQIQHTLYTTMTGEESNNEKYSIEKTYQRHPNTNILHFMFYDSVLSVELSPNKWIFFVFFFSSRFSCEYCIFVATVLWYRLVAKPYNSTCCSIEKRTAQLNSTLLSENGGIHVKGAACVVLLQQTQKN